MPDDMAPAAGSPPFEELGRYASEYVAYGYKNIVVIIWTGAGTGPGVRAYQVLFQKQLAAHPSLSAVHVVVSTTQLPDAEGRKEFDLMAKRYSKRCASIVSVIEREGFVGSALRAFTAGLYAITSRDTVHHVVRTLDEAASWMWAPHTGASGVSVERAELAAVFAAIRARHA